PPGTSFDGIDGGLLNDALARGGEQVINNSVLLSLTLSDALLANEREDFLASLFTRSSVGYGSGGSIAGAVRGAQQPPTTSIPAPPMTSLAVAALIALGWAIRKRPRVYRDAACSASRRN